MKKNNVSNEKNIGTSEETTCDFDLTDSPSKSIEVIERNAAHYHYDPEDDFTGLEEYQWTHYDNKIDDLELLSRKDDDDVDEESEFDFCSNQSVCAKDYRNPSLSTIAEEKSDDEFNNACPNSEIFVRGKDILCWIEKLNEHSSFESFDSYDTELDDDDTDSDDEKRVGAEPLQSKRRASI